MDITEGKNINYAQNATKEVKLVNRILRTNLNK